MNDQIRGARWLLAGVFLAIIGSAGIIQAVADLRAGDRPQALDVFARRPTSANLRDYEHDLETQSHVVQSVRPWMQYLRFLAWNDAGEKAVIGLDGWWFYRPDVQYLTEPCPSRSAGETGRDTAVAAITSFRDQLAHRGIRLLIVPIPVKPGVYPEKLAERAAREKANVHEHTRQVLTDLAAAGVETLDLFAALAASPGNYLVRDTHWTPQGAQLAADVVAQRVRGLLQASESRPSDTGGRPQTSPVGQPTRSRYDTRTLTVRRLGDIVHMIQVPQIERWFEPESATCEQVIARDTGERYRDDPDSDVLVLGDSFLRIYERDEPGSAGFIAHLARALDRPVTSIVSDGGASTLVRQELARRPELLDGKRLVIWEFVERDIRFGMEGWQDVRLPETRPSP